MGFKNDEDEKVDQDLINSKSSLVLNINLFNESVSKIVDSGNYATGYVLKLHKIRKDLLDIQVDLQEVK